MDCDICYSTFKDFELIRAGCCTAKLCKDCIYKLKDCPQCKKKYSWLDHNQIKYYKNENIILKNNIYQLEYDKNILIQNKIDNQHFLNDCVFKIYQKDIKITALCDRIDELNLELDKKQNINELEEVIKKYNLNII
jgi:hypothetical protein